MPIPKSGALVVALLLFAPVLAAFSARAADVTDRPEDGTFIDSSTLPLRVHGDEEQALPVLTALEAAWTAQVLGQGFDPPPPDGAAGGSSAFDAYLVELPPSVGALAIREADVDASDGKSATTSFLRIDPTLTPEELAVVVPHEFNHAVQNAVDARESVMFAEAAAVVQEVLASSSRSWVDAVPVFQRHPEASVFADGAQLVGFFVEDDPRYEYGAALFLLYLEETYGAGDGTLVRALWQASTQEGETNEPDWLDALPSVVGRPTAEVLLDFATWRLQVGALADPVDVDGVRTLLGAGELVRTRSVDPALLDDEPLVLGDAQPFQLGCATFELAGVPTGVLPVHVRAKATREGRVLGVSTLILGGPATSAQTRAVLPERAAELAFDVPVPADGTAFVAICDVTEADADDAPEPQPIEVRMLRTDIDPPDAGVADAGPDVDGGSVVVPAEACSCQATHAGNPARWRGVLAAAGTLVGLIGLFVRGARHARRQRLYKKKKVAKPLE